MKIVCTHSPTGKPQFDTELTGLPAGMSGEELQCVVDMINRFSQRGGDPQYWVATDDYELLQAPASPPGKILAESGKPATAFEPATVAAKATE